MKYAAGFFIAAVLCCVPAFAQESFNVEFGAHAGLPLNHTLESAYCCTTGTAFIFYQPSDASYLVDVSGGILILRERLHVSFGATYMPVFYIVSGTTCCPISHPAASHNGTAWEFPLLGDYRWLDGSLRPYSGGGLVLFNRTSGGQNQSPAPAPSGGVELSKGNFVIHPEFRFIHYTERDGADVSVGRPPTQMQFLIGMLYRIRS